MCGDFKRGNCNRGDNCKYSHADEDEWDKKDDKWDKKDEWAKKDDWEKKDEWAKKDEWDKKDDKKWDEKGAQDWGAKSWEASSSSRDQAESRRPDPPWSRTPPPQVPRAPAPVPWARDRDEDEGPEKRRRVEAQPFSAYPSGPIGAAVGKRRVGQADLLGAMSAQVTAADRPVGAPVRKAAKVAIPSRSAPSSSARPSAPGAAAAVGARRGPSTTPYATSRSVYDPEPDDESFEDDVDPLAESDPKVVLETLDEWPDGAEEWLQVQDTVWANHPPLPHGWIRCWSRSYDVEYYARLQDNFTTFERSEVD